MIEANSGIVGNKFGTLTVRRLVENYCCECECDCGRFLIRRVGHLSRTKFCSHDCPLRNTKVKSVDPITGMNCPERYFSNPEDYEPRKCNRCPKMYLARRGVLLRGKEVYCSEECSILVPPTKENVMEYVNVDPATECWNWKYDHNKFGRATITIGSNKPFVAPFVWELFNGTIPARDELGRKLLACHTCDRGSQTDDRGACVNPNHIFIGTHKDNMVDCANKGRTCRGIKNPNAIFIDDDIREIRRRCASGESQASVGLSMGASQPHISRIVLGKIWGHVK